MTTHAVDLDKTVRFLVSWMREIEEVSKVSNSKTVSQMASPPEPEKQDRRLVFEVLQRIRSSVVRKTEVAIKAGAACLVFEKRWQGQRKRHAMAPEESEKGPIFRICRKPSITPGNDRGLWWGVCLLWRKTVGVPAHRSCERRWRKRPNEKGPEVGRHSVLCYPEKTWLASKAIPAVVRELQHVHGFSRLLPSPIGAP